MNHDLPSTRRTALTAGVVMALGAGLVTAGVLTGAAAGGRAPVAPGDIRLVSYDSCATALTEMKNQALPHVGPFGFDFGGTAFPADGSIPYIVPKAGAAEGDSKMAAPAEAPAREQDHSATNVQEAGVDEPDLVKTDGKRVVSITDGVVRVVDVASREETAVIHLEGGSATQLLVDGDRALVMTTKNIGYAVPDIAPGEKVPNPAPSDTFPYGSALTLVDLSGAGSVLATLSVDGSYLDARQIGDVARVVVRSAPHLQFRYPTGDDTVASLVANKDVVTNSAIQDWLPRYELTAGGNTSSGQLTACDDVSHPADYSATAMLTVLTFDLTKDLGTGDPVTIVADGDTVYGTDKFLYVADDHLMEGVGFARGPAGAAGRTELYQFDISKPGKPVHVASGAVDGSLLNQYSLSEYDGNLRVATTTSGPPPPSAEQTSSESRITVLTRKGNELTQVGVVGGLGAGERIYAVRFFDDTAYVVTFRQTDPLYTVDLSDPAAPKVTGELKITGYSAYLHPAGDGRLIGVGQEASETGRTQGTQVSLFDTSNPAGATRIAQYHLDSAWSEVESDPHAFLYWPDKGLLVLPVTGGAAMDPGNPNAPPDLYGGALVLKLKDNAFTRLGLLDHTSDRTGTTPLVPRRALVIGNELWTVSEAGMLVSDVDSLAQVAWIPFT